MSDQERITEPILIRRSIWLLVIRIIITELVFELMYVLWRFVIDSNIFQFSQETLLAINAYSLLIFFIFVIVVQTCVLIFLFLDWSNKYYEIRPKELVIKSGIISSQERSFPVGNIQAIRVKQGLIGRILNYGTIEIYIPTLGHDLYFTEIPNPYKFVQMIKSSQTNDEAGKFIFRRR